MSTIIKREIYEILATGGLESVPPALLKKGLEDNRTQTLDFCHAALGYTPNYCSELKVRFLQSGGVLEVLCSSCGRAFTGVKAETLARTIIEKHLPHIHGASVNGGKVAQLLSEASCGGWANTVWTSFDNPFPLWVKAIQCALGGDWYLFIQKMKGGRHTNSTPRYAHPKTGCYGGVYQDPEKLEHFQKFTYFVACSFLPSWIVFGGTTHSKMEPLVKRGWLSKACLDIPEGQHPAAYPLGPKLPSLPALAKGINRSRETPVVLRSKKLWPFSYLCEKIVGEAEKILL